MIDSDKLPVTALQEGLGLGMSYVDTAEMYGSERRHLEKVPDVGLYAVEIP